jgi:hypothetical protein
MGFVASLALACGSAGNEHGTAAIEKPGLNFHQLDAAVARGVHVKEGIVSRFDARLTSARAATTTLRVNDKVLEIAYDQLNGRIQLDGHDSSFSAAERAAIKQLYVDLEARYRNLPEGEIPDIPFHVGALMGAAVWLADTAGDMTIGQHQRQLGPTPEKGLSIGPDYEWRWYRAAFVPSCAWHGNWYNAWFWPNINGQQNFTGGWTWEEHVQSNANGRSAWPDYPGGDWTCQGQCGVGCQWALFSGGYQDCLEHDRCTQHFADVKCNTEKIYAVAATLDSRTAFDCR